MTPAQHYVSHIVIDGKRPRPAPAQEEDPRWKYRPKHATQLLARGNRLLRESESGLCIRDWGSESTPADQRYYLEDVDGSDWALIGNLPKFVAELAGGTEACVPHETKESQGSQV